MLNKSGITKTSYGDVPQILADINLQASVGVIFDDGLVDAGADGKKIVHAGMPLHVDFANPQTAAIAPTKVNKAVADLRVGTAITSIAVVADTFATKVAKVEGRYVFIYGDAWYLGENAVILSDYGITVTGTPVQHDRFVVDFSIEDDKVANAVALHDVDVTAGDANGTALYFGVVNKARVKDATTAAMLTPGKNIGNVMVINRP